MAPDRFTHAASDTIPDDRLSDCAGNRKTESSGQFGIGSAKAEGGEVAASHASTGLIDLSKLGRPQNSIRLGERQPD